MTICSDKGCVGGQPRMEGTRLWISHVITHVNKSGLDYYIEDFELQDKKAEIKNAIEYCMKENCVDNCVRYCTYCTKASIDPKYGVKFWKIAKKLHKKYLNNK